MKRELKFTSKTATAQGALEYLLILVAAIIVVAIVVIFISGFTGSANQGAEASQGTIIDSFTNWGNMLGGNTQGTTPPAPTTCAQLEEAGTLVIEGQTVFCDNVGKMWTPASENTINASGATAYCGNLVYSNYEDWRVPTFQEHQTFRLSLPEHCPINGSCISTPSWDSHINYAVRDKLNSVCFSGGIAGNRYFITNISSQNDGGEPLRARCVRDE